MPSVQRFLSGRHNLVRDAQLAASSVRASTAIERVAARRAGGGRVRLAGAYSGHEAARVDVEIVAAGGVPRASVPQFVGVGNGALEVLSVDAAAPLQELTFTLADLGIPTEHARLDVREVQLRARVPGAAGNAIRVTVTPQLTRTATAWALLADWSAGTAVQTGTQWDFGALPLSAKGELDPASPRIQFGYDPQVYRPWRRYKDGEWQFGVSPGLQRNHSKGTTVYLVTGGYLVTVTDGVTTEQFGDTSGGQPQIVTFHELLMALQGSALVEVTGVVVADRAVGGQAAVDVPLRTQAWLYGLGGKVQLQDVAVPPQAPTQTLLVRCINADVVGRERWSVSGDVSGALPVAVTGEPYNSPAARFLVPTITPSAAGTGEWNNYFTAAPRQESQGEPAVCIRPFELGPNARPRTVTFVYRPRPPADCDCRTMATPKISRKCLGTEEGDGMSLDPAHQTRLQDLYAWRSGFAASNTKVSADAQYARHDMDFADTITDAFAEALGEVYESAPALTEWDAAFAAMQSDLATLIGMNEPRLPSYTPNQASKGMVWFNSVTKHAYLCTQVTPDGPHDLVDEGSAGWVEPADAVWDSSGAEFVVVHPTLGATLEAKYRRIVDDRDLLETVHGYPVGTMPQIREQLLRRYTSRMDYVRTLAGIVPKSDSSSGDAGGCWTDYEDRFWWVDPNGHYLPAFTNRAYHSARRDPATGKPYSTQEFAFGLVVACPERLIPGDQITISIAQVDGERPYQVGDEAVIQTIAAGPAWLVGGVDGTDVQTWRVAGSVSGPLPDYIVPTDGSSAPAYDAAGALVRLALGGIPFVLGDAFALAVEAGQYRWRTNGGAWSPVADIPAGAEAALADGLVAHFDAGAAPSFTPGDAYTFDVHQPWAVGHVRDARASAWGWVGADASLVIDMGAVQPLGAIALARYELPEGAAVTVEASDDGTAWDAPIALDVSRATAVRFVDLQARYLRVAVTGAPGGCIGMIWAGQPVLTDHHASSCVRRRRWAVGRGSGLNPSSLFAGVGDGWSLSWSPGDVMSSRLLEADVAQLVELIDWAQEADEPLVFVPHYLHPLDAALVRVAADALDVGEVHEYQPDNGQWRRLTATLELEPVFA